MPPISLFSLHYYILLLGVIIGERESEKREERREKRKRRIHERRRRTHLKFRFLGDQRGREREKLRAEEEGR